MKEFHFGISFSLDDHKWRLFNDRIKVGEGEFREPKVDFNSMGLPSFIENEIVKSRLIAKLNEIDEGYLYPDCSDAAGYNSQRS